MQFLKSITALIFILTTTVSYSQKGFIRGTIADEITGELLPGVTVAVDSIDGKGAITDLDGNFSISIEPGKYTIKISYVSYTTIVVKDVVVKDGEANILGNIKLKEAVNEIGEAFVTAEMIRNNENALLTVKKRSPNLIDAISNENFKKLGVNDAGSAMKNVPGVSVSDGKYVFIRGLGDRYNKTTLNGVDIPGLDPDRNTIQMDLFPTAIIDNIIVNKSFNADLPADFTGGVIDISLKDFPESKTRNYNLSTGYNPNFHFNPNFLTYEKGKTDFLGFDDGTREIPAINNVPYFVDAISDPNGPKGIRYKEILSKFNPNMAAIKQTSFMDYSFGTTLGNQFEKEKVTLGYNFVFSYRSNTEFYENATFATYGLHDEKNSNEFDLRQKQNGDFGTKATLLTGLASFALKTKKSKYAIDFLHIQNGQSKAAIFDYENSDQGAEFDGIQHNLEYSQRSISNVMIKGKHDLNNPKWNLEWKLSPTYSKVYDPDIRFTRYEYRNQNFIISTEAGFPARIWREINEINVVGLFNATKEFKFKDENAKFKFGVLSSYKQRDFAIYTYLLNIRNLNLTGNPDELFQPENLWPYNNSIVSGTTYEANFKPFNPNQFNSSITNFAGYVSTEINPTKRLKSIIGLRSEYYTQRYTGRDQVGTNILDNEKVLENLGIFPSLNIVFAVNENQNLRFSFGKTIARPSFKEMSYAEIADPSTGRTFIGGLFRDADDNAGIVYWDGNLTHSDIYNYDVRWETFPSAGQTISIGAFYKKFIRPIEIVQFATQAGSFQPRNVGDAQVIGGEIEIRQSLSIIKEKLKSFSLIANFTITDSKIKLSKTEFDSRVENARDGQSISEYRNMAGQAPYIINVGLAYTGGEKGFSKGLEAGIYFNMQGETLQFVGIADRPDIYAVPFHSLNFNLNKRFGKDEKMTWGMGIQNLLNDKNESIYKAYNTNDAFFSQITPGIRFQFRFAYNL